MLGKLANLSSEYLEQLFQIYPSPLLHPKGTKESPYCFRISATSNQRLEIGSGTLEMNLDQDLENRIDFWTKIW